MANYDFSTITPDQALAYNAQTDSLSASRFAGDFLVVFDQAAGGVRLIDTVAARSVFFGSGFYGERVTAGGGQSMQFGTPGADFLSDGIYTYGGPGNDTVVGASFAYGGAGSDVFVSTPFKYLSEVRDWESTDSFWMSSTQPTTANYVEGTAADQLAAIDFAGQQLFAGKAYVAVAVGADLYVFADTFPVPGLLGTKIIGRGLGDISAANFQGGPMPTDPALGPPPPPPPPPVVSTPGSNGTITGNMDAARLHDLNPAVITVATGFEFRAEGAGGLAIILNGFGFTYSDPFITGGTVTSMGFTDVVGGSTVMQLSLFLRQTGLPAPQFETWLVHDDITSAFATILAGDDLLNGGPGGDLIRSLTGNDTITGYGGPDTLYGGLGNDTIRAGFPQTETFAPPAATYLRGDEGDDRIYGGQGFDDANGNMGNDTVTTGAGDDYAVGGKDNDNLFGEAGGDIVWGNLGNDTQDGGDGADQVRGGQGDDTITGGAGDDFVSGDRGNDTIAGGSGADLFHGSQDAGIDRVVDFNLAQGDRVFLDPGTTYTLAQVGADTVLDMGGGNQMILVGVQMSALTPGWVFGA